MKTIIKYSGKGIEESLKWLKENRGNPDKREGVTYMEEWVVKAQEYTANPITVVSND